jgi:hypothetical protein
LCRFKQMATIHLFVAMHLSKCITTFVCGWHIHGFYICIYITGVFEVLI